MTNLTQVGNTAFLGDDCRYAIKIMKETGDNYVCYLLYYIDTKHDRIDELIRLNRESLKQFKKLVQDALLEGMKIWNV